MRYSAKISRRAFAFLLLVLACPAAALALSPHGVHHLHATTTEGGSGTAPTTNMRSTLTTIVSPATISGTTYYVSPSGSDLNSGTSATQAWRTLKRVNAEQLKPGDGVLFQGGQTFSDTTLMPSASGTSGHPIVYGSYGTGRPIITQSAYFIGLNYITFDNLKLLGSVASGDPLEAGNGSTSGHAVNNFILENCDLEGYSGNAGDGVLGFGNNWTITGNMINGTGDSGMVLTGDTYSITNNTITNTGLHVSGSGEHGIYLIVSNATITGNTITNFRSDGISVRKRNSVIENNNISGGPDGIGFFEEDSTAGTSTWSNNTFNTSETGIYVSPFDTSTGPTLNTIESFVIQNNTITPPSPVGSWVNLTLDALTSPGTYTVSGNAVK